jgi:hypothetical protein
MTDTPDGDRPLCDTKFCDRVATWRNEKDDTYACDAHVTEDGLGWVQPLGWLTVVTHEPVAPDMSPNDRILLLRLEDSMTNHTPSKEQLDRIEDLRDQARALAWELAANCPESRERSLAATHLEECLMWAVKSIVLEHRHDQ